MKPTNVSQQVNPYKSRYKKKSRAVAALASSIALVMFSFSGVTPANAAVNATATVQLGTAGNYSVLAGSQVVKNGTSILSQSLGLSPGISVNGLLGGILGTTTTDTAAARAQADLRLAYADIARRPITATVNAQLGGQTLKPGVYQSNTGTFLLDGVLTLDGQNNPNSVFILKADALKTGVASQIRLINGAQACRVFIQVDGSANLGSRSAFVGTLLALDSITANVNAKVEGRLLANRGAVYLNANLFAAPGCKTAVAAGAAVTVPKVTVPTVKPVTPSVPALPAPTVPRAPAVTPDGAASGIAAGITATVPKLGAPEGLVSELSVPNVGGLVPGLTGTTPAETPSDTTPTTDPGASPNTPAPAETPASGSGSGAGSDDGTGSSDGIGASDGTGSGANTGEGNGSVVLGTPEGAGMQDGTAIFGNLPATQGGFPVAQDAYSPVGTQGELAQTGANSLLPVAMVAGVSLLLIGIGFIFFLNRRRLPQS